MSDWSPPRDMSPHVHFGVHCLVCWPPSARGAPDPSGVTQASEEALAIANKAQTLMHRYGPGSEGFMEFLARQIDAALRERERQALERAAKIADEQARLSYDAGHRAASMGRHAVANCREADEEMAQRIAAAIRDLIAGGK